MTERQRTLRPPRASRAFTLIELLVVVVILGVLSAVAAVAYNVYLSQARATAAEAQLANLETSTIADAASTGADTLSRVNFIDALNTFPGSVTPGTTAAATTWSLLYPGDIPTNGHTFSVGFSEPGSTTVSPSSGTLAAVVTSTDDGRLFAVIMTVGGAASSLSAVPAGTTPAAVLMQPSMLAGAAATAPATPSAAPTPSATATPSATPSASPTPTATPSASQTPTATPSPTTSPTPVATACDGAPTSLCLQVNQVSNTTVYLGWNTPAGFSQVSLRYRAAGSTTWLTADTTSNNNDNIPNLQHGVGYEFSLLGTFSSTPTSRTSNTAAATIVATPTPTLTPTTSNTTVYLVWSQANDYTGATVYYRLTGATAWTSAGTTSNNNTSVPNLHHGSSYDFQIIGTYVNGAPVASTIATAAIPAVPAPTLTTTVSNTTVYLSWTQPVDYVNAAVQYRLTGSSAWTTASTVNSTSTSITGLTHGSSYDFQIVATFSNGDPTASNAVTNAIPASAAPALSVQRSNGTQAQLLWTTSADYTGATVYYRVTGATSWSSFTTGNNNTAVYGLSSGSTYNFYVVLTYNFGPSVTSSTVTG
jgi:prepilin-type N-terminal cleavage/methylation domain-containing protein